MLGLKDENKGLINGRKRLYILTAFAQLDHSFGVIGDLFCFISQQFHGVMRSFSQMDG